MALAGSGRKMLWPRSKHQDGGASSGEEDSAGVHPWGISEAASHIY